MELLTSLLLCYSLFTPLSFSFSLNFKLPVFRATCSLIIMQSKTFHVDHWHTLQFLVLSCHTDKKICPEAKGKNARASFFTQNCLKQDLLPTQYFQLVNLFLLINRS